MTAAPTVTLHLARDEAFALMAAAEDAAAMLAHAEAVFDLLACRERNVWARDHNGIESVLALSSRAYHAAITGEGAALTDLKRAISQALKSGDQGGAA